MTVLPPAVGGAEAAGGDSIPRARAPTRQLDAPTGVTVALGLHPLGMWGVALLAAAPPAVAAALCGAPVVASAMAGLAGWAFAALCVHRSLLFLRGKVTKPIAQAIEGIEQLRSGEHQFHLREAGAPIVELLAQRLNAANAAVDQRSRVSQVTRMSAETAFERIHAVLQSLIEGVVLIDAEGGIVLTNPCARRFLEFGDRPIEGQRLDSNLPEALRGQVIAGIASLREGRERVQIMGLQAGDRVYDVSLVHAQSMRIGAGFGTVVAMVDVTRNHEIARLKDDFLGAVSHELRTPLTNICAFTEILGQLSPDNEKDWQEFLAIVTTESNRLRGMVEDLLEHSRLHTGQVLWRCGPVDLGHQVGLAMSLFTERSAGRGVDLSWEPPSATCIANADCERLHEVLVRLIDNALKFTPGGGRVRVEVADLDTAIEVAVDDSGPGVPLEHRESVFERFHQIGDPLTEKPSGAGLGLPICRGFIDGMGGSIWCEESELGGAKFRFVLPSWTEANSVQESDHESGASRERHGLESAPEE